MTVRPSGPCPARVMLCGEAPGEREVEAGAPFVGPSGQELDRMLSAAGIMRSECFSTNVVRVRPPRNDITAFIPERKKDITREHVLLRDRMVLPVVVEGYNLLQQEIKLCQPNVIIALGNTALWALTGKFGIKNWRGSLLETDDGIRVIPTWHPAAVLRQWELRSIAVQDMRRAAAEMGGERVKCPEYQRIIRPQYSTTATILNDLLLQLSLGPLKVSYDIETNYGAILCIGLAWSRLDAICIPFTETQRGGAHYWQEEQEAEIVHYLYRIMTHKNFLGIAQNGLYDCQYLFRAWHFLPRHHFDTMIAQHSCFSTMPKGLDFIASMYCDYYTQWKGIARNLHGESGVKKDD